jgi:O-antigen/teichoic acid export membrane protein
MYKKKCTQLNDALIKIRDIFNKKVFYSGIANTFSVFSQFFIQIASVPLLINAFGIENYGIWILISTVPVYIALSDVGLINAATSDMAMAHAANNIKKAQIVFQTMSAIVIALFSFIVFLVFLIIFFTSSSDYIWTQSFLPHVYAIPLLTAHAALSMISALPVAAFRASGHYARGTLLFDIFTLLEACLVLATATLTQNLVWTAAAPLFCRALATPIIYLHMRRVLPCFQFGLKYFSFSEVRRLTPAAFGLAAIPIGLGVSLQGMALIIGAMLGPAAVALFVAARTASRAPIQIAGVVTRALVPEASAARGRYDLDAGRHYQKLNWLITLSILFPSAIIFGLYGVKIISIWTGGVVALSYAFTILMAGTIVAHGFWYLTTVMLTATHEHLFISKFIIPICIIGILFSGINIYIFGIIGAALGLLFIDILLSLILISRIYPKK